MQSRQNIYSVSRLNREAKYLLETELGVVWISAEISNLVTPASGHWYFTLKDDRAQLRCAMFKGNNQSLSFRPKNGDQLLIRGRLSLYEARGDYQLIADMMEPAGDGLLKQQFERLKQQLAAEGLFATHYKQPLPDKITRVGVVTSGTGAAIKDILAVAKRRQPSLDFILYPSLVQGDEAAFNISHQIQLANSRSEVDVLIVGRGGGSLEDLWCFNEEAVARAIFHSEIPVISAVGHEIDFTIADFVADFRAATPSAASEMVTSDSTELLNSISITFKRLYKALNNKVQQSSHRAQLNHQRLLNLHPERQLQQQQQKLDEIQMRLQHAVSQKLSGKQVQLQQTIARLQRQSPDKALENNQLQLEQLEHKLELAMQARLTQYQQKLKAAAHNLNLVSPLATLARGYSINFNTEGSVIRSVSSVKSGDEITTRLTDGEIISKVI